MRSKNLVVPTPDDLASYATETEVNNETSGITELKELNSKPPYFAAGDNDGDSDVEELEDLGDPKGPESGSIKLSIVSIDGSVCRARVNQSFTWATPFFWRGEFFSLLPPRHF